MLKYFSVNVGVSSILSPNTIISGESLHYKQHLGIKIGQYLQVHKYEDPSNSQVPRTKVAIFLGPSGNEQGGFQFMSLNSAKNITRRIWDTILIPGTSTICIKELAFNGQNQFIFADRRSCLTGDVGITGVDRGAVDIN